MTNRPHGGKIRYELASIIPFYFLACQIKFMHSFIIISNTYYNFFVYIRNFPRIFPLKLTIFPQKYKFFDFFCGLKIFKEKVNKYIIYASFMQTL